MEKNKNITEKLKKIVKNRKTPVIITKREIYYKTLRGNTGNLSQESFSYILDSD